MPTYYIDNDFASAVDPDGSIAFTPIDITSAISARVYRNGLLIGTYSNISSGWTTPIDTEVIGAYTIEYFVTDARGETATISRQINISRGILTDENAYSSLISQVSHGIIQAGYHQSLSPDGDFAACSFLGHWADITNASFTFPTIDYNAYSGDPHTSDNRATCNGHGAIVFQKSNANNPIIMQAQDILGYWKTTFKVYAYSTSTLNIISASSSNAMTAMTETGQFIRWTYNGITYTYQVENVGVNHNSRRISIVENRDINSLSTSSSLAVDAYTTVYSEAPGKDGKLADITLPYSTAPSIVPRVPIIINGSPYTRARNMASSQAPEGFAWTMRYESGQWIVDGLFSTPLGAGSYRKFGRNVQISKDGSTIAIHAKNYTYIYKRVAVFSGLIYQRSSSTPSVPASGSASVPTGWSSSDPGGSGNLYACRGKTTNSGSTYSWSSVYLVTQPDFPHSGNIHTNVSADYGWNLVATFSGGDRFGESISFSSDGNIVGIGDPGDKLLKVYEYNGSSWSQKGATINSPLKVLNQYTNEGSRDFGRTVSCDDSGLTFIVGGDGWYSYDPQETDYRYPGSVNCYAFVNGSWEYDSIRPSGHIDYGSPGYTQTSQSTSMYFQPTYGTTWNYQHGRYVALSADGETMYVVSKSANQIPKPKPWDSSKVYSDRESTLYNNNRYLSLSDNNVSTPTDTTKWLLISTFGGPLLNWVLGYDETNKTSYRGNILRYKKIASSLYNSGFYWKYDGYILPPKTLGYYGWYHNQVDSIAISSDASTIVIGGSSWRKYTVGDNGGTRIGPEVIHDGNYYYPGGWAFIEQKDKEIRDYDSAIFSNFINENYGNPDIHPDYFPAPKELTNGGNLTAVKSLNPNESFIIYIDHTSPSYYGQNYIYYLGGSNSTPPLTSESTGVVVLDTISSYQSIEVFKNNPSFEYFWVRIYDNNKTSNWSSTKLYNSALSINSSPPAVGEGYIYANLQNKQVVMNVSHGFTNSSGNTLSVENQAEEYEFWDSTNSFSETIQADYSLTIQKYIHNEQFTTNYSSPSPEVTAAHIKTFYVRAKNSHSNSLTSNIGTLYTYDWDQNVAPGAPANFTTNVTVFYSYWKGVLMDFRIPYDGYSGGQPEKFIFYKNTLNVDINTLNAYPNSYYSAEMDAVFEDSTNIKTDGFRHSNWAQDPGTSSNYLHIGDLNVGSTYYFWVRATNQFGTSSWVASSTGGVTIT
jgi:hypothetical protein